MDVFDLVQVAQLQLCISELFRYIHHQTTESHEVLYGDISAIYILLLVVLKRTSVTLS